MSSASPEPETLVEGSHWPTWSGLVLLDLAVKLASVSSHHVKREQRRTFHNCHVHEVVTYRCTASGRCSFRLLAESDEDGSGDLVLSQVQLKHDHQSTLISATEDDCAERLDELRESLLKQAEEQLKRLKSTHDFRTGYEADEQYGTIPIPVEQQLIVWSLQAVLGEMKVRTFERRMRSSRALVDSYPKSSTFDGPRPSTARPPTPSSSSSPPPIASSPRAEPDSATRILRAVRSTPASSKKVVKRKSPEPLEIGYRRGRPGRVFPKDDATESGDESEEVVLSTPPKKSVSKPRLESPPPTVTPARDPYELKTSTRALQSPPPLPVKRLSSPTSPSSSKRRRLSTTALPPAHISASAILKPPESTLEAYLPHLPHPASSSTFSADLDALLATLHPLPSALDTQTLHVLLTTAGITTSDDLATVLLMERQSLGVLNAAVESSGGSKEDCLELARFFQALRIAAQQNGLPVQA